MVKIVTDSMVKLVPGYDHLLHEYRPGLTITDLTRLILDGEIKVSMHAVLWLHIGTNSLAPRPRRWRERDDRIIAEVNSVPRLMAEVKRLKSAIRRYNRRAMVVFSAVLPRPCDDRETGPVVAAFNARLKAWAATELRVAFVDSATPFLYTRGPQHDRPRRELFNSKGLHLSQSGEHTLATFWSTHLCEKGLRALARQALRT